jgi:hypothetical protein
MFYLQLEFLSMQSKKNIILLILFFSLLFLNLYAQKRRVTGTVEGRVAAPIKNDAIGSSINSIGLAGLEVNLRYKKGGIFYQLGTTFTDENGNYTISYNKKINNQKSLELSLCVLAKTNSSFSIRSKNCRGIYKYNQSLGKYGMNVGTIPAQNVFINDEKIGDAFRSVHWTRKGMNYFRKQSVPIKGGLTIKINKRGSYSNNYIYCKYPVIYLRKKVGIHENTVYPEFGHYLMYRLQNNHIKIPLGVRGVNNHGKKNENTGLLAWIEGWACAMQSILDAAHWQEDNEFELDAYGYTYENLEKFATINNGFRSEYHIATAIYDLWDGPNKGLPEQTPYLKIHGWDDSELRKISSKSYYPWKSKDDVELTLAQICAPLQTVKKHKDMKHLRNVGQYYDKLVSQLHDCKDKADVSRVFRENRVLWNIKDYENGLYIGNLSSDQFFTTINQKEKGFLRMEFPLWFSKWNDTYHVNIPYRNNTKYNLYALPNTPCVITDDYWIGIYDVNQGIYERMEFYLNPNANESRTNLKHGKFYTCGSNEIWIKNGSLELGMMNSGYTAELTISEGSVLKIEEQGKLILNNHTILRIAAGGTLQMTSEDSILKRGNASVIIEEGAQVLVKK